MDDNADGLSVYSVGQVWSGSVSGVITDDSETLWLDNLESYVAGRACSAPDRGHVSKNESNKQFKEG